MELEAELLMLFLSEGPQHVWFEHGGPASDGDVVRKIVRKLYEKRRLRRTEARVQAALRELREHQLAVWIEAPRGGAVLSFAGLPEHRQLAGWLARRGNGRSSPSAQDIWELLWLHAEFVRPGVGVVVRTSFQFLQITLGVSNRVIKDRTQELVPAGAWRRVDRTTVVVKRPPGAPRKKLRGGYRPPSFYAGAESQPWEALRRAVQERTRQFSLERRRKTLAWVDAFRKLTRERAAKEQPWNLHAANLRTRDAARRRRNRQILKAIRKLYGASKGTYRFEKALGPFLEKQLQISATVAESLMVELAERSICQPWGPKQQRIQPYRLAARGQFVLVNE